MDDNEIASFVRRLSGDRSDAPDVSFAERRAILAEAAAMLDSTASDSFELAATRFAVACDDTISFARDAMDHRELDAKTRFLIFTMGAIACRRSTDRMNTRTLFGGAGEEFDDIPLFKHLEALSYDGGSLRDLRYGLELEREAYRRIRPQAGSAHAQALFIVQIVEQSEQNSEEDDRLLGEGLDLVDEAISQRDDYAKYHYTRGRLLRQLGDSRGARAALLRAIELENRTSVDAPDRLRDYRLELKLVTLDRTIREAAEASEAVAGRADRLEQAVKDTDSRLKDAQIPVVAAVGFIATAIGLVQVTLNQAEKRPFIEAFGLVVAFGIVLFGTVYVGLALLRRR